MNRVGDAPAAKRSTTSVAETPIGLFLMINTFETGGSERQFSVLAQNVSLEQFRVHLGCVHHRGPLAAQFPNVPQFRLGGSLYGWKSVSARIKLARHLRANRIQIAHGFDFYTNLVLTPAARLARVPVVIGSHRQLGDLLTPRQFRAQAAAFRWCDAVVCNSRAAADRLASAGVAREKLAVIGNAVPDTVLNSAERALPCRPEVLRVGMVARMNHRYKNHEGFLRIAAEIHKQMPKVEFVLAGDGPLRTDLERRASDLGLGDRVIFLGDRRDIPAVLASLDVAVLTSESESLSNVILEAMAARLPVVAYDVGGNSELIDGQRGILVAAGSERQFADETLRLLSDADLRRRQGENARRFVEENFSIDHVRRRYEDLYLALLKQKHQGRSNT